MVQGENNENQKKKNRLLPLIWLGGTGLVGAIIVLGILYAGKQSEVKTLAKQLADTTTVFIREKEALGSELAQVTTRYDSLMTGYNQLNNGFVDQKNRNRRLAGEIAVYAVREKECKKEYTTLKDTAEQLRTENETLKNDREILRSQSDALHAQLAYRDSVMAVQMAMLGIQDNKLKNDSASLVRLKDSLRHENSSGYFNSTELNGAYGLAKVDIPYSHYYFGLTTVNGYAVNRHLFTGLGIGLLSYDAGLATPIYLDFRYHFGKSGFSPYIFTDCGVIFKFGESIDFPIVFFNPGIGFCKSLSDKFGLNFGAGVMMQRDEMKSSFVNLKLGFVFLKNGGLKPWVYTR
jgi:hypothetical protein